MIALSGWMLASYDFDLLVVALPDIAKDLHLTASFAGLLGFIIYAAMFSIALFAGRHGCLRGQSISGRRAARELTVLIERRGKPNMIVSDKGTEFTSNAVLARQIRVLRPCLVLLQHPK